MEKEAHEFYRQVKAYGLDKRRQYFEQLKIPLLLYERGELSGSIARYWLNKMKLWIEQLEICPIPFPLAPSQDQLGKYDIEFGKLLENPSARVGLRLNGMPRHLLIGGGTESGKSTLLRKILISTDDYIKKTGRKIVVLVLDLKGDFVDLPARFGKDRWNHYSLHSGFRVGGNPPCDCNQQPAWIDQFTEVFAAFCNLEFSEGCFISLIRQGLNRLNVPLKKKLIWPSLPLIKQLSQILPEHLITTKRQYKQTLDHKLNQLLQNSGHLFFAEEGFDVVKHMVIPGKSAVIDCTAINPLFVLIVANIIFKQLLFSRIFLRQTSDVVDFILIIDEADMLCLKEIAYLFPQRYSPLGQLLKQGREFGIMVCLSMTLLHTCDPFITSNASIKVLFKQEDPDSVLEGSRTILEPSSKFLLDSMPIGQCIFKESLGSVRYPMLVETDYVERARIGRPEKFDAHSYEPPRMAEQIPQLADLVKNAKEKTEKTKTASKKDNIEVSRDVREFLDYVSLNEYEPAYSIFKRMKVSSSGKQLNIVKQLEEKKLIDVIKLRSSSTPVRLIDITEKGWLYLKKQSRYAPLRGGPVHTHVCRWIQFWAEKNGYDKAECECQIAGLKGFCDVMLTKAGKMYAYEVVVDCTSNILKHVRDVLVKTDQIESLTIVTRLKSDWDKMQIAILSDPKLTFTINRVQFDIFDTFMKGAFKNESH